MNSRMTLTIGSLLLVAATFGGCSGSSSYSPASPSPTVLTTPPATPPPAPDPNYPDPAPMPDPVPAGPDLVITITGMNGSLSYSPSPATVKVGQTVVWKNADRLPHTATANGGTFNTGTLAAEAISSPITMTTAGTFPYFCAIHPSMTGTLTVIQ